MPSGAALRAAVFLVMHKKVREGGINMPPPHWTGRSLIKNDAKGLQVWVFFRYIGNQRDMMQKKKIPVEITTKKLLDAVGTRAYKANEDHHN